MAVLTISLSKKTAVSKSVIFSEPFSKSVWVVACASVEDGVDDACVGGNDAGVDTDGTGVGTDDTGVSASEADAGSVVATRGAERNITKYATTWQ